MIVGRVSKVRMIFVDLRNGSGGLQEYSENVQLPSAVFGRLLVNFLHLRNTSDYRR